MSINTSRPKLPLDFKAQLQQRANESLQRHFQKLESDAEKTKIDPPSQETLDSFFQYLKSSNRILALVGAGLSVSSGIPTYRSAGGFWRVYSDAQLATLSAFNEDSSLVWQFHNYRRHQAFNAKPNAGHIALAELAACKPGLFAVNQNIDGLCGRAGYPSSQIVQLHGSLSRVKCSDGKCNYEAEDYNDPIVPALQLPENVSISDAHAPLSDIRHEDLPTCPKCKTSLLRPAIVWFGESVPEHATAKVDKWLAGDTFDLATNALDQISNKVDLLLVIGTSAVVYPAAAYIEKARKLGARVAYFNMEVNTAGIARPEQGDWSFVGNAAELLPKALQTSRLSAE